MNDTQKKFINDRKARLNIEPPPSPIHSEDLKGRIALVTGAASGLGRSIAIGLARAAADVALLDLDHHALEQTAALIKKERTKTKTLTLTCDVTNESDVEKAFETLLQHSGGIEILVNAAGVAPAYPLTEFPLDKWRFAMEVNLTGYFLLTRMAAKIMIEQQIGGSIILISSKSALEASVNNSAYNAAKAAQLHLARGWAMELGTHQIRVNCVCPGNVFEGSKIWNPDYINAAAQKYGIKPQEVIPYYVNKTILKRQVKGEDIAQAVIFLASDKARTITGQIIVADSGQVMVR